MQTRKLAASGALAIVLAADVAHAGGFAVGRFGADHGQPALGNAYAVYFNPGAMGAMDGSQFVLDGTLAIRTAAYSRPASALSPSEDASKSDPRYVAANTGQSTLFNVLGVPYVGFVTDFGGTDLRFGYATYVPFGGAVRWEQNSAYSGSSLAPGAVDGPQRWQSISDEAESLYNTVALAYRIRVARLSIGAGVSLVYNSVHSTRARNPDGSDDVFAANGGMQEGRALLDVSGMNVAVSAGIHWEPLADRSLRIGLSYVSPPAVGQMRLHGQFHEQLGTVRDPAKPKDIDFLQTYPDIIRLGVAYRVVKSVDLRADASYERWSRYKRQCVVLPGASCDVDGTGADASGLVLANFPREWKDAITARAGVGFWLDPATELFGSGTFGTPAAPKSNVDPTQFDSYTLGFTLGLRYEITKNLFAAASYNYIDFLPFTVDAGQSKLATYAQPSRSPSADGRYEAQLFFVNANVTVAF